MRRARGTCKLKYCHTSTRVTILPQIAKHLSIFTLHSFDFVVFLDCFSKPKCINTEDRVCDVLDDPVEADVFVDYSIEKPSEDKACQIPETIQNRQSCAGYGVQGTQAIMRDILTTKRFKGQFRDLFSSHPKSSSDDKLLNSLAKDYIAAKDKEQSRLIRAQCAKISSKLLIGDSMKGSKLNVSGVEQGRNRTETARAIGRVSKFGDERRRLLSIVAQNFTISELQSYFPCSKSTITVARVHAILFGKGGVPRDGISFTRQAVSPEVIAEFQSFVNQDDISRPSSCRSVLVDGKETGVRYWQCDIKNVIQQYQLKFPDGLKRTYIYSHLPKNFRMNSMLAGLCNLCDDFGHSNFESLQLLLDDLKMAGMMNAAAHSETVSTSSI